MIQAGHFASTNIQERLDELHRLWDLLMLRLAEKGLKLQQAQKLVQFQRECDEVIFWINDKETFVTTGEWRFDKRWIMLLWKIVAGSNVFLVCYPCFSIKLHTFFL